MIIINSNQYKSLISENKFDDTFYKIYGSCKEKLALQKNRYLDIINNFDANFGKDREICIYSSPARTEICGNHTDHNNGVVLAAAVNVDAVCVVSKNKTNFINVISQGFSKIQSIDISDLKVKSQEKETPEAIIKGVCAGIIKNSGNCGGCDIYISSDVLQGSGLSSSAAFEVAIATVINHEFCDGKIDAVTIAKICQYAENEYFGKPSGLMDQLTISVGGVVKMDFKDDTSPIVEQINFDLDDFDLALCIVDSKATHADLTQDYADIKAEMCSIAQVFWKKSLREIDYETFINHISYLKTQLGDRAILRGIHFYAECQRVQEIQDAIKNKDKDKFISKIIEGGHSSFEYNQNAYSNSDAKNQPVSIALAAAQCFLQDKQSAWRLQGGGFAGTIQCFVKKEILQDFVSFIEAILGENCCHILDIRNYGAIKIQENI